MPSNIVSPKRENITTHILSLDSIIFESLPVFSTEQIAVDNIKNETRIENNPIILLEDYIGFNGFYSKIKLEDKIFYTKRSNLTPTDVFKSIHQEIIPLLEPTAGIISEEPNLYDWLTFEVGTPTLHTDGQTWFVVTQTPFEGSLSDEQTQQFMDNALIDGLQLILRKTGKKFDKNYVKGLVERYYFFGKAVNGTVRVRNCSEFCALVTLPKRYLNSAEIVNYVDDPAEGIRDGIQPGIFDSRSDPEDVAYVARYSFLDIADFALHMNDIHEILKRYGEDQDTDAKQKIKEYIGSLTIQDYKREIDLDISALGESFFKEEGNFFETIQLLLTINGVDIETRYEDVTKNNILFGFDSNYEIIYIDIVRNGKLFPLFIDGDVFKNTFGNFGVKSKRHGYLLWNYPTVGSIRLYKEIENKLTIDKFINTFIIPPPKEVNLPKVTFECAKNNFKKLAEDAQIKGLTSASTISQIVEFNARKGYAVAIEGGNPFIQEGQNPLRSFAGAIPSGDSLNKALANEGLLDFSSKQDLKNSSLRQLRKIFRRTDFQKSLIAFFICQLRKTDNTGATNFLNAAFNSQTKAKFQEWFKNTFCSQFLQTVLKAFQAFKKPVFRPMDLNEAIRREIQKALVQLILELYEATIKILVRWLSECSSQSDSSPFTAEQDLGINAAIDDLLNNNDSPETSPLNDAYDSLNIPAQPADGPRASEEDKKAVKDLLSDITCILRTREVCQLMAEGTISDETYAIVRALVDTRYPTIAKAIRTKEDLVKLFKAIGNALGLIDVCAALPFIDVGENRCGDRGIEDRQREALANNGLTPKQIDDIIQEEKKKLDDRLNDILNAVNGRPEDLPIFCENGRPGIVNIAKVDEGYRDMFSGVLEASLDRVYEQFNKDVKAWPKNMAEESQQNVKASAEVLAALAILEKNTSDAERNKALEKLIEQKVLEKEIAVDEEGNKILRKSVEAEIIAKIAAETLTNLGSLSEERKTAIREEVIANTSEPYVQVKDANGRGKYKLVEKDPNNSEAAIISPILVQTLKDGRDFFSKDFSNNKNNKLVFKVISDDERARMKSIFEAVLDQNVTDQLKKIQANNLGRLTASIVNELVVACAEVITRFALDEGESDVELFIGFDAFRAKNGPGDNITILKRVLRFLVELLYLLVELFDIFIAQVVNEPKGPLQQPPIVDGSDLRVVQFKQGVSPRQEFPVFDIDRVRRTDFSQVPPTKFVQISDTFDAIYSSVGASERTNGGEAVGSYDKSGIINSISRNQAQIALNNAAIVSQEASKQYYEQVIKDENLQKTNSITSQQAQDAIAGIDKKVGDINEENKKLTEENQAKTDKINSIEKTKLVTGAFFDSVTATINDFKDTVSDFERSILLGPVIRLCKNAAITIENINTQTRTLFQQQEDAANQLKTLNEAFPNFKISYEYGQVPTSGSLSGGQYKLLIEKISPADGENNKTEYSSSFMNVVQKEIISLDVENFINSNGYSAGFSQETPSSLQQYVFKNYLNSKLVAAGSPVLREVAYTDIETSFVKHTYDDLKSSFFYNSDSNKINNIRYLEILEQSDVNEEYCGIRNNPLDLDEIKDDVKNNFLNEACNYEAPRSDGKKRDKMNPVENGVSSALVLATLRVYIYDYYLKGIFLFDKYNIGMTAGTVMIDFLANCFESEMRSRETAYADRFLAEAARHFDSKNAQKSKELQKTITNPAQLRKIKFKELIKEQVLYVSARLSKKIEKTKISYKQDYVPEEYNASTGRIYKFFDGLNESKIKVTEEGLNVVVKYEDLVLLSAPKNGIKDNVEYKFLFEYCFPIRKYVSLVTIQAMIAANARINSARTFSKTKALLKVSHNQMMSSPGYKDNRDSSDIPRPIIGSGDARTAGELYMEIIIEFIVKTPLRILKGLCEISDPNVFLASLPYNIAKPITLALNNELPFASKNAPLFYATPLIGVGLIFCFIPPTPFGVAYYLLKLWEDEDWQVPNKKDVNSDAVSQFADAAGVPVDSCLAAKSRYKIKKPAITNETLILQYA